MVSSPAEDRRSANCATQPTNQLSTLCIKSIVDAEPWNSRVYSDDTDNVDIVCIHCRVTDRNEDLFHGNKVPGSPPPDPSTENQHGFCLCNRPHGSDPADVNSTLVCDRRAVSDTTADSSEPQRYVKLGVPKAGGVNASTGSRGTYTTDYKYDCWYCTGLENIVIFSKISKMSYFSIFSIFLIFL